MVPAPQRIPSFFTITMSGTNPAEVEGFVAYSEVFKATATIAGMPMPDGKWRA